MNEAKVDPAALLAATMAAVLAVELAPGRYTMFEMTIGLTLTIALINYGWPSVTSRDSAIVFACATGFGLFVVTASVLDRAYEFMPRRSEKPSVGIAISEDYQAAWWLGASFVSYVAYCISRWRRRERPVPTPATTSLAPETMTVAADRIPPRPKSTRRLLAILAYASILFWALPLRKRR